MSQRVNRPFWLGLRWLLKQLLKPWMHLRGFRVEGQSVQGLPQQRQPLILAANHAAFIDSIYLILAVPARFTICGAKPRLFRSAPLRALMALANILEVRDKAQFMDDCGDLLQRGEVLLIYPEMGRFPQALGEFKTWAAEIALAHRVPILPCYLWGTTEGQAGPVRLLVGQPLSPEDEAAGLAEESQLAEKLTATLRQRIVDLAAQRLAEEPSP